MKRILVIEDEDNNLHLIRRILQIEGFEVVEARTGEEGIARAISDDPDAIVLDIGLPDIDGWEVLRRLRALEPRVAAPIVAMTSYAMSGDRERLLQAGCAGYIEKPIDPRRVGGQLREILQGG